MMFHDVSCFTPTCFMEEISRIDTQLVKKYCRITNPHIHKMAATFLSGYQAKTWRITNRQTFSYSVWYAELRIAIFLKYCRILQNSNSSYNWNLNWNGNWASQVALSGWQAPRRSKNTLSSWQTVPLNLHSISADVSLSIASSRQQ